MYSAVIAVSSTTTSVFHFLSAVRRAPVCRSVYRGPIRSNRFFRVLYQSNVPFRQAPSSSPHFSTCQSRNCPGYLLLHLCDDQLMRLIPLFRGQNGGSSSMSSSNHTNGYVEGNSPNSSQLSSEGGGNHAADATLISRTQKQHTTQQVRSQLM